MPIIEHLHKGGIVACPTEGVWGLSCVPTCQQAINNLFNLKKRPFEKNFIIVGSKKKHLLQFVSHLSNQQQTTIFAEYSHPTTWVVPLPKNISSWTNSNPDFLAVRLIRYSPMAELCTQFDGALISTSANPSGQKPATTQQEVKDYFSDSVFLFKTKQAYELSGKNSEIIHLLTKQVIRKYQ